MFNSISFSVQQNDITKKIFKVFSNSNGVLFLSLHYFKSEEYHCGNACYPPGVASIQLSPIIEGKKSPIPVKASFHEDGQVHFKPINPQQINAEKFYKFAGVKSTPFDRIVAQHIFTIEFVGLERFNDIKQKEKDEFYGIFNVPNDSKRFKFLGYLGKSEKDILDLVDGAKVFTINRKGTPSQIFFGLVMIPFPESLDKSSPEKAMFYFLCGFNPEALNHNSSATLLYLYSK